MEGKVDEGIHCFLIQPRLLIFEREHPQQLASWVLIVPDSYGVVVFRARGQEGSLEANIHSRYWGVVKSFEQIVKVYCFLAGLFQSLHGFQCLREYLVHVDGSDVIVLEGNYDSILFCRYVYASDLCLALGAGRPLPHKVYGLFVLIVLLLILLLNPEGELSSI